MTEAYKIPKVVIDTNIWISFLIGKNLHRLLSYIFDEKVAIFTCKEQLTELSEVVEKPKLKKYFRFDQVAAFFNFLEEYAVVIPVTTKINICRDPKDNYLLALSIDADAHYLITGDDDLLVLQLIDKTSIVNFTNFEKIISNY
ncbi:hypothetical protein EZS27_000748 [termite gut metagenome]|uniref:PIN domain-containing protein n=1 Tax=termite gut metagenome TaxID=433724 RepID=A0A5J4T2R8_9ZZZZ